MADQTESASDDYPICEDECVTWGGHADNCRVSAAIRALEAKAVDASLSAFDARADVARWMNACEAILKLWEGADLALRADRDRIAAELRGTQTRLSEMAGEVADLRIRHKLATERANAFGATNDRQAMLTAEGARLTAELAEAREDAERYRWLRTPREFWDVLMQESEDERWHDMYLDGLDAAIDAARRSGEGEA